MSSLAALARDLGLIPGYSLNYHHVREGSYLRMEKWRSFFILELPIVNMEKQHVPLGIGAHYIIKNSDCLVHDSEVLQGDYKTKIS